MKTISLCTALLVGCGISEDIYNAKVAELNKVKASLDAESAARKKCNATQAALDRENEALKAKLTTLGQDISNVSANLDTAKKRIEEMRKAQEIAEKRAAQ